MPGPRRGRLLAAVKENTNCAGCHPKEASEWKGSHHHISNTNPAYRKAFAIEPMPFCRGCHAPEADPKNDPPGAVSEMGVGCVTCHVTEEGTVLAAPDRDPSDDPPAPPHPLVRSEAFGHRGACAACHEFAFPAMRGPDDAEHMQTTVREHERSPAAKRACADCHMPLVEGRRSHAFTEMRDPAWLRSRLYVTAQQTKERKLRLTLAQIDPGHAFPSGDLFRRLEVGCELRGKDGRIAQREVRYLERKFELLPRRPGRTLTEDNRLFFEPLEIDFPLTSAVSGTVRYWVTYQRIATVGIGTDPTKAVIESEVPLYSANFAWD